jgi:pyridoxal 5'-phosphate synthase subunit Pdx1
MWEYDQPMKLKVGLAEMLKGGVIMDVTTAEQAKIAEDAGATAVMALERVPADIRKEGGVARMASIKIIKEIMAVVTIPVMAKARIGHFAEAQVLEAVGVDYIDESEVLTPADEENHILKWGLQSAVCVRRAQSGRSAAACRRRRGDDSHQGRSGLGQHRRGRAPHARHHQRDSPTHHLAGRGIDGEVQGTRRPL